MPLQKVLITVVANPRPSKSYDELVCTAGVLEDGTWVRIYPVPLAFLKDLKSMGKMKKYKYSWIEIDLIENKKDFRPESHRPNNPNIEELKILHTIDTKNNWSSRKKYCLQHVYTDMAQLIEDSKDPKNISLATFKPSQVSKLKVEKGEKEWDKKWVEKYKQLLINFEDPKSPIQPILPRKVPYTFKYVFKDSKGRQSNLMIEDWEIAQLYFNCLNSSQGDEEIALKKVRQKYETQFIKNHDLYFFLGTTKEWHRRKAKNPFVIIGVFYPKKESELTQLLFS